MNFSCQRSILILPNRLSHMLTRWQIQVLKACHSSIYLSTYESYFATRYIFNNANTMGPQARTQKQTPVVTIPLWFDQFFFKFSLRGKASFCQLIPRDTCPFGYECSAETTTLQYICCETDNSHQSDQSASPTFNFHFANQTITQPSRRYGQVLVINHDVLSQKFKPYVRVCFLLSRTRTDTVNNVVLPEMRFRQVIGQLQPIMCYHRNVNATLVSAFTFYHAHVHTQSIIQCCLKCNLGKLQAAFQLNKIKNHLTELLIILSEQFQQCTVIYEKDNQVCLHIQ